MGIVGLFVLPLLNILSTVIDLYFKVVAVDIILYWLRPHALVFTLVTTSPGHICHGSGFHALPHPWASSVFVPLS